MERAKPEYTEEQFIEVLKEKPHTALGLKKRLGCTKPTAYARIAALKKRMEVREMEVREGLHGPKSKAYYIAA